MFSINDVYLIQYEQFPNHQVSYWRTFRFVLSEFDQVHASFQLEDYLAAFLAAWEFHRSFLRRVLPRRVNPFSQDLRIPLL